jgi:hypothetical protein
MVWGTIMHKPQVSSNTQLDGVQELCQNVLQNVLASNAIDSMRRKVWAHETDANNTSPNVKWELLLMPGLSCAAWPYVTPNVLWWKYWGRASQLATLAATGNIRAGRVNRMTYWKQIVNVSIEYRFPGLLYLGRSGYFRRPNCIM